VGHEEGRFELGRSVTELRIEILIDDERRRRRRQQCVAIGRRAIDYLSSDVSGRAGSVVDDDRLAPFAGQPIADNSWNRVRRPTGRKRYDDFHGAIWILFGAGRAAKG